MTQGRRNTWESIAEVFQAIPSNEAGCMLWPMARSSNGYGHISLNYKTLSAHKVAWELKFGAVPDGLVVMHKCDTRACVNVEHLQLGTYKDNMQDCSKKRRIAHGTRNPHAKLTDSDVREIRELYASGKHTQWELARRYGVWQGSIWQIIKGKAWRHLL
jgi:hypothetical protein